MRIDMTDDTNVTVQGEAMIGRDTLVAACDARLEPARFKDFTVNGLQVSGKERINRIMSGVTACQTLLDEAVAWQADLVLVHQAISGRTSPWRSPVSNASGWRP